MIAAVVVKHERAVREAQEKVRILPGFDEVKLFRIKRYDNHDSPLSATKCTEKELTKNGVAAFVGGDSNAVQSLAWNDDRLPRIETHRVVFRKHEFE